MQQNPFPVRLIQVNYDHKSGRVSWGHVIADPQVAARLLAEGVRDTGHGFSTEFVAA